MGFLFDIFLEREILEDVLFNTHEEDQVQGCESKEETHCGSRKRRSLWSSLGSSGLKIVLGEGEKEKKSKKQRSRSKKKIKKIKVK